MSTQTVVPGAEVRQLLIVDDEAELLQSLVALFERHYKVVFAHSGDQALELLQQGFTPQVILSDNRMPGISGIELLAKSTLLVPDAVRVIMTGFTDIRDILAAINQGHVYMYLTKPWQVADLLQAIRICFQQQQMQTHNKRLLIEMERKNELLEKVNAELSKTNKKLEESNGLYHGDLLQAARSLGALLGSQQRYYYSNHSTDCAQIAGALGQALGLKGEKLIQLETAALLHDIGLLGLPLKIQKANVTQLVGPDLEQYQSHVRLGAEMLRKISHFSQVADLLEQHHERLDGSGFPYAICGPRFLRESQILALADLYHDLVYRVDPEGQSPRLLEEEPKLDAEVLRQRQRAAGQVIRELTGQFDPEILTAFCALAGSNELPSLKFS